MGKNIKLSLIVVTVLIIICAVVVVWNPWKEEAPTVSASSDGSLSSSLPESSAFESSLAGDSSLAESSASLSVPVSDSSLVNQPVIEDQPDEPNLNFETSGSSYSDIMVNVLTCILSKDMQSLSQYVGSAGLRLSPTGQAVDADVVLSASQVADFFSLGSQSYGVFPGSGESIYLSPTEYYNRYLMPEDFDFASATVSYNDEADLAAAGNLVSDPKTVSYYYSPNVMEWKQLIMVYGSEGSGDVLCALIYRDATTD